MRHPWPVQAYRTKKRRGGKLYDLPGLPMASLIYNSLYHDALKGNVDLDVDSFKMLLVTSSYTAAKSHSRRSDITNEVSGTGYTSGGASCTLTLNSIDNTNNRVTVSFSLPSWPSSTITARGAVVYKARGGASSSDELVCFIDFGSDISSSNDTLSLAYITDLLVQN